MRGLTEAEAGEPHAFERATVRSLLPQLREIVEQIDSGGDSPVVREQAGNIINMVLRLIPETLLVGKLIYDDYDHPEICAYREYGHTVWDFKQATNWANADKSESYM